MIDTRLGPDIQAHGRLIKGQIEMELFAVAGEDEPGSAKALVGFAIDGLEPFLGEVPERSPCKRVMSALARDIR